MSYLPVYTVYTEVVLGNKPNSEKKTIAVYCDSSLAIYMYKFTYCIEYTDVIVEV